MPFDFNTEKERKCYACVRDAIQFLVCSLSNKVPSDPVIGRDGYVYEREELEKYIENSTKLNGKVPSPVTSSSMDISMTACPALWCAIESMMWSGSIPAKTKRKWERRCRWTRDKALARKGKTLSMKRCGQKFLRGSSVVKKDRTLATFWMARSDIMAEDPANP
jgi:hypothetical protein